jgi:hypothetical protein
MKNLNCHFKIIDMNYKRNANRIIYTNATRPESKLIDTDTILTFGKHKGKTPVDIVLMDDTKYLIWLFNKSTNLKFTDAYKRIAGI